MKLLNTILAVCMATTCAGHAWAAAPQNYYNQCENKGGQALLTALYNTVGAHTTVSYDGLWNVFNTSDVKPNGKIWDMYSTKEWTPGKEHCGNYKLVGDCINREHSFPKSWFNNASPMSSDAYHLYPTDGKVNGQRSNFPYGECAGGTTLASNGSIRALGRLGTSTFPGYSGKVFEPDDEYKGDFARSYFYMAAAYNNKIANWNSDMLAGNAYPAFSPWAVNLLLKWHRQDPVSDKEKSRNDAVYAYQKNRNPFIDHPEMVEYIWGDKVGSAWTSAAGAQPAISIPVNNTTIDMGTVAVDVPRKHPISVKGSDLTGNVTLSLADPAGVFSLSTTSLTASSVNSANGATVTVTLNAKAATTYSATLTIASATDKVSTKVALTAVAMTGLPATAPTQITDQSFVAHWTYVGTPDSNGCYTLYVKDTDGNDIDTYPRAVPAADESYLVDELEPETDYTFFIKTPVLTSNVMNVRTAAPIPSIQILYDGDLDISTEPGVPSEPVELLLDIENIFSNITFAVDAPFQLSSDKDSWSTTLAVDPREDRIYLRILSDECGIFTSAIHATAGDYSTDDAEVTGTVASVTSFLEDFENEGAHTGNYTTTSYTGNASTWELSDAGVFVVSNEAYSGKHYLRLGKSAASTATMTADKEGGIGVVTVQASGWSPADGATKFALDYSTDGGSTWETAGEASIATPASTTKAYAPYTFTVNRAGNVRLRIRQTYGQRACIDDIAATGYSASVDNISFGDDKGNGWDAWCTDGVLCISLEANAAVAIHGTDGITYFNGALSAGNHSLSLPKGLYIVVIGLSTRRVLVK